MLWHRARIGVAADLYVAVLVLLPLPARAQDSQAAKDSRPQPEASAKAKDLPTIEFTHRNCAIEGGECRVSYTLNLDDGQRFAVRILDTQLDNFTYTIAGVPHAVKEPSRQRASRQDTTFTITHDKRYGGYIVTIRRRGELAGQEFPNATLVISVTTNQWNVGFAGGFSVSQLIDGRFSLRDTTVTLSGGGTPVTKYVVQRDAIEDEFSLHTATFVHVWHSKVPQLAATFGLGIGSETAYFIGPTWRWGDVGGLTVGAVFGSVKDLPAGLRVGDVTSNANALATLAPRNVVRAFFAVNFTFLGSRETLQKPFQGGENRQSTPDSATSLRDQRAESSPTVAPSSNPVGRSDSVGLIFQDFPFGLPSGTEKVKVTLAFENPDSLPFEPPEAEQAFTRQADGGAAATVTVKIKPNAAAGEHKFAVTVTYDGKDYNVEGSVTVGG